MYVNLYRRHEKVWSRTGRKHELWDKWKGNNLHYLQQRKGYNYRKKENHIEVRGSGKFDLC